MRTQSDFTADQLRDRVGLPPLKHDVFVSYRFGKNGVNPKLTNLVAALKKHVTDDVIFFDVPEEDLTVVQRDAVQESRIVIALIEQTRQLHYSLEQWGLQYYELSAVADLFGLVDGELGSDDDRVRARPYTLICYFGDEDDKGKAINELLPQSPEDRPTRDQKVFQLLKRRAAWKRFPVEGTDEPEAEWLSSVVNSILRKCEDREIKLSHPVASRRDGREQFNYEDYVGRRAPSWRRGFPFAQPPPRHGDADVSAFEVNQSQRIPLSALLEKPVKGGPGLTEISDVIGQVRHGRGSCWVLGQPGAGKTTVLTEAAAREAERSPAEQGGRPLHPMVFELKRFNQYLSDLPYEKLPPSLVELMAQDIRADGDDCDARHLGAFLQNHPHSLYLDGFDDLTEIPQLHLVNLIGQERLFHPQGRIIISSRTGYEHVGLDDFEKLTLNMLSSGQLETFIEKHTAGLSPRRAEVLRSGFDVVKEAFDDDKAGAPLRTPFFLQLISQESRWAKQISGSATTIYTNALSRFFKHITRHDERSLGNFDTQEVLTELAWLSVNGKVIEDIDIDRAVSKKLDGDAASVKEIRARRFHAIEQSPVLLQSDTYSFRHKIFAEHLAATDVARRWYAAASEQGRTAVQEARQRLVRDLVGDDPSFSRETPAHVLIDRIPHVFFDTVVFSHLRSGDESEAAALVRKYCAMLCAVIRDAPLATEDAAARAATALLQLIRALDGLRHSLPKDLEPCAKEALAAYRTQAGRWHPVDREMLLGALGQLDPGCWEAVTNLSAKEPLTLPSVELRVPIWDRENAVLVEVPPLLVSRKPVLVSEYREFGEAPDRYDSRFWPMLSPSERREVEREIMPSLTDSTAAGQHEGESRFCVIGDAPNAYIREHWKEQLGHPFRPVTNVAWREAVAYALWLSARGRPNYRLPGPVEWSHIVSAIGTPEKISEMNLRSAGLHMPSTIGIFLPNHLGLFDFGANVAIWLNQYDPTTLIAPWPPGNPGPQVHSCGASYLSRSSDAALVNCKPQLRHRHQRHPWVGIWLVETG